MQALSMSMKKYTLEEAKEIAIAANMTQRLSHSDLFALLEVALTEIQELKSMKKGKQKQG